MHPDEKHVLRREAHQAWMSVWSGLRTRRPVRANEYEELTAKLCSYLGPRFKELRESVVLEAVQACLIACLSKSYIALRSADHDPEDFFDHLDNYALARLRPDWAPLEDIEQTAGISDGELVSAIFGGAGSPESYRDALRRVRIDGDMREYNVVTQVVDLYVEFGTMPTGEDIASRLPRFGLEQTSVTAYLLRFANRMTGSGA